MPVIAEEWDPKRTIDDYIREWAQAHGYTYVRYYPNRDATRYYHYDDFVQGAGEVVLCRQEKCEEHLVLWTIDKVKGKIYITF